MSGKLPDILRKGNIMTSIATSQNNAVVVEAAASLEALVAERDALRAILVSEGAAPRRLAELLLADVEDAIKRDGVALG